MGGVVEGSAWRWCVCAGVGGYDSGRYFDGLHLCPQTDNARKCEVPTLNTPTHFELDIQAHCLNMKPVGARQGQGLVLDEAEYLPGASGHAGLHQHAIGPERVKPATGKEGVAGGESIFL